MDKTQPGSSKSPDELLRELVDAVPVLKEGERTLVVEISHGNIRRRRVTLGPLGGEEFDDLGRLVKVDGEISAVVRQIEVRE
jgi:hypothetical protein